MLLLIFFLCCCFAVPIPKPGDSNDDLVGYLTDYNFAEIYFQGDVVMPGTASYTIPISAATFSNKTKDFKKFTHKYGKGTKDKATYLGVTRMVFREGVSCTFSIFADVDCKTPQPNIMAVETLTLDKAQGTIVKYKGGNCVSGYCEINDNFVPKGYDRPLKSDNMTEAFLT